jgi:hypothetical protein
MLNLKISRSELIKISRIESILKTIISNQILFSIVFLSWVGLSILIAGLLTSTLIRILSEFLKM